MFEPGKDDLQVIMEVLFDIRTGVYHVIDLLEENDEEEAEDEP